MKRRILVIGGGAAGMMAAIIACRRGAVVTLIERNPRVGKKLLVTGNGRCNYTNTNLDYHCFQGENPQFAAAAFRRFDSRETMAFFEELGVVPKLEEEGKVYPWSDQASSVLDLLLHELEAGGVKVMVNAFVRRVRKQGAKFQVELADGSIVEGDRLILTPGGKAKPSTGSDGNGYDLARSFGHTITPLYPGLVQLKLAGSFFHQIQGVKLVGTVALLDGTVELSRERGDIIFGNYGLSGPPVFQLSSLVGRLLAVGKEPVLRLTIIDRMDRAALTALLNARFQQAAGKSLDFSLVGFINKRLIPVILKVAGFQDLKRPAVTLTPEEIGRIGRILTDWRFPVRGTKSWPSAQVTVGGVATDELNPETMESKLVPGLFLAGEIIDLAGRCGGYNLQWAWSSGYVAGENAAH
ncbi:MAG TPA: NAD(P)/FAD-dependent oxidoreductase [Firmicutes bacterium]|jgi:predicted Rossmann fold flavoprotein|nr:NAD(P)/FAD-dependent oxidoreductase [Bacillota bacterium]